MTASPQIRLLPWDTEFFGLPIGRLDAPGHEASGRDRTADATSAGAAAAKPVETADEEETGRENAARGRRRSAAEPGPAAVPGSIERFEALKGGAAAAAAAAAPKPVERGRFVGALEAGLTAARALGLACVYFETPFTGPVAPATFSRPGFHLADVRVVLRRDIGAGDLDDKDAADGGSPDRSGDERRGDAGDFSGGSRPRRNRDVRPRIAPAPDLSLPGPESASMHLTAEEYKENGFSASGEAGSRGGPGGGAVEEPASGPLEPGKSGADPSGPADIVIEAPREGDDEFLVPIAEDTAMSSRFRHDPRFGPAEARRLYREWLRVSLHKGYAEGFLVARGRDLPRFGRLSDSMTKRTADRTDDQSRGTASGQAARTRMEQVGYGVRPGGRAGRAVGFLTIRIKADCPWIDLVGVAPEARGRGIGGRLIRGAAEWAAAHGFDRLNVATQAHNISALALYQRAGFLVRSVSLVYHVWLDEL